MVNSITHSDHYIKSPIYIFYDQINKFSHFAAISITLLFIIFGRPFHCLFIGPSWSYIARRRVGMTIAG